MVALAAACLSCGSETSGSSAPPTTAAAPTTVQEPYTGDAFATPPSPLPDGEPGTLIRYRRAVGDPPEGAVLYQVLYLSRAVDERPIAVTGLVAVPDAPAPEGGRRLVTVLHGTNALADACAPSAEGSVAALASAAPFLAAGDLVAMTDYEGLGTPGRHPYLVGRSEGRSALDAIRAARQLPGASGGDRLAIAGYSQGGHGAIFANEMAASYAPELEVVGTFAGAPYSELDAVLRTADAVPQLAVMLVAGFDAAHAEADPAGILTERGLAELAEVDAGCADDLAAAFRGATGMFLPAAERDDRWRVLAVRNTPGQVRADGPLLVVHSAADTTVPIALTGVLTTRLCTLEQVVERVVLRDGEDHAAAADAAWTVGVAWLEDRFAGEPVETSCPAATG